MRRRKWGGRIEGKGTATKKRGQRIYVRGATGGDAKFERGGGEANMGRGMPISGCHGLQRRLRGEPDAIMEPDKAGDGVMFTEIGCELFKPKCFRMFQCMEAVVGMCRIGRVSSTKAIVEGLKKLGFSANNVLEYSEDRRGWPVAQVTVVEQNRIEGRVEKKGG